MYVDTVRAECTGQLMREIRNQLQYKICAILKEWSVKRKSSFFILSKDYGARERREVRFSLCSIFDVEGMGSD